MIMKLIFITCLYIFFPSWVEASVVYFNSNNYRKREDNPFLTQLEKGVLFVEDFENQGGVRPRSVLTTPYATGWNGLTSGSLSRGVQEDYSNNDPLGHSWTNSGGSSETEKPPNGIHFDFTPDVQGRLPDYVGAALRGSTILGNNPNFNVILVYDSAGQEVTEGSWLIPKPVSNPNQAMEDLFLNFEGIYVPGGISRIHFRDFREVDHLTYGYAIPEPSSGWLAMGTGIWLLSRRRRSHR